MTDHSPDHDEDDDSHDELTRNNGEMPSGAGAHELTTGSVDPGYGDSSIDSLDDTDADSDEE